LTLILAAKLFCQQALLSKSIDTTQNSVCAILYTDTTGRTFVTGSGVLIHPRVVLTAGHVNYNLAKYHHDGFKEEGQISFSNNAIESTNKIHFNWLIDVVSHPDTADFMKSTSDTTGKTNPTMFIDIGLIFLNDSVKGIKCASLSDINSLQKIIDKDTFSGAGYGYNNIADSTFTYSMIDGYRRTWTLQKLFIHNNLWVYSNCDSIIHSPYLSIGDSGAPLFINGNTVVGVWSYINKAPKPCSYSSWAVRVDNTIVLKWIKEVVHKKTKIKLQ
jgi:V8-like Glu-specific endopeptidase